MSALAVPLVTATSDAVKPVTASLNVKVAMKAPLPHAHRHRRPGVSRMKAAAPWP